MRFIGKRDAAVLAALLAATIMLGLIGFGVIKFSKSEEREELAELPKEFLKAVYYANKTTRALQEILSGEKPRSIPSSREAVQVSRKIEKLLEEIEGSKTRLAQRLREMGEAYSSLAYASGNASRAASIMKRVVDSLLAALEDLDKCEVEGFLDKYSRIRGEIDNAATLLRESLYNLALIDPRLLASPSHIEVYKEFNKSVSNLLLLFDRTTRIYSVAKSSQDLLERLCKESRNMPPHSTSERDAKMFLEKIGCKNCSPRNCPLASTGLGHPLADLLLRLQNMANWSNRHKADNGQGGIGGGAGYGEPESDD